MTTSSYFVLTHLCTILVLVDFVLDFTRTAFERQIHEAVTIQNEITGNILNSRAEWGQSSLPRLTTRMGDPEKEFKELEKEIRLEKENEDRIEEKVRQMRKTRNKARLVTDNNPRKRQKLENNEYISIRKTWGPPTSSAPTKNKTDGQTEELTKNKKIRLGERITNTRRIEDRTFTGEVLEEDEFEIETIDWDKFLQEHRERLEKEAYEKEKRLELQRKKTLSWALYKECKDFLEENQKDWIEKKKERDLENQKKERLENARNKKEILKEKVKERKLKEEINIEVQKLPISERKNCYKKKKENDY